MLSAKYDPNGAMRQRFWRNNLISFDKDHTGQLSRAELLSALEATGLEDVTAETIDKFYRESNKNPDSDELTVEEAMVCLEREYGVKKELKEAVEEAEVEAAALADTTMAEPQSPAKPFPELPAETEPADSLQQIQPRPARSSMFGHSRDSIYELEKQLKGLFMSNPQVFFEPEDKEHDEPKVPASALPSILTEFSGLYNIDLLEMDEADKLKELVEGMADVLIGPEFLISFIAKITGVEETATDLDIRAEAVASNEAEKEPSPRSPRSPDADDETEPRGRSSSPESPLSRSRATSRDSVRTSVLPDEVPETPKHASVFDVRQRSTPLMAGPPSSWASKPVPAAKRRRSSVGSVGSRAGSDTEVRILRTDASVLRDADMCDHF